MRTFNLRGRFEKAVGQAGASHKALQENPRKVRGSGDIGSDVEESRAARLHYESGRDASESPLLSHAYASGRMGISYRMPQMPEFYQILRSSRHRCAREVTRLRNGQPQEAQLAAQWCTFSKPFKAFTRCPYTRAPVEAHNRSAMTYLTAGVQRQLRSTGGKQMSS